MRVRSLIGVIGLAALVGCTREIRVNAEDPAAYIVYVNGEKQRHEKPFYIIEAVCDIRLTVEHHGKADTIHLDRDNFYRIARTNSHIIVYEYRQLQSSLHISQRYPTIYSCRK